MLRSDVTNERNVVTGNALNSDTSINMRSANRLPSKFLNLLYGRQGKARNHVAVLVGATK